MPSPDRRTLAGLGVAAAILLAITWSLATRGIAAWEPPVGRAIYDLPDMGFRVAMQLGSRPAPIVAGVLLAVAGWRWRAAAVTAAGWLAWGIARAGKVIVDRPRPTADALGRAIRDHASGPGFPSSHAAIAFGLAVAAVVLGRPRRAMALIVIVFAITTAIARVHLGVHWPLDVLGGAAAGTIAAVVVALVVASTTPARERRSETEELVVATFNIRNGRTFDGWNSWPFRRLRTVAAAQDLDADVLAVQEAYGFQARALALGLPAYRLVGRGRNRRGGESCAVYVRADRLDVVTSTTRWYGDHPDQPGARLPGSRFPRVVTLVTMRDRATGADLELANTHLDERSADNRLASARQLASWIQPAATPTIVVGDLNATWREQPDLLETLTAAGLTDALPSGAGGTAHDYRGGLDHRRIDHILVSEHWRVLDAAVIADDRTRRFPSDHWPVVARLRLVS